MKTTIVPVSAPVWYVLDATDKTIGALATVLAHVLRGKHKTSFSPHQLCGDHVIVTNVEKLKIDPMKGKKKTYFHHTGYLGHWSNTTLEKMMEKKPEQVIEMAVKGMLPKNRLSTQMQKRLHVMQGDKHKYAPQKPVPLTITL